MRYECTLPGFEGCYIDIDNRWTKGESRFYLIGKNDAEKLETVARKLISINLGEAITRPEHLTVSNLDMLSYQLSLWFDQAIINAIDMMHEESVTMLRAWRERADNQQASLDRRYICDIPGFTDCYVQITDNWLRGDVSRYDTARGEDFLALVRSKVTSVYLSGSSPIDEPAKLTTENTDRLDYVLWRWFSYALQKGKDDLQTMGEANARRSLRASGN